MSDSAFKRLSSSGYSGYSGSGYSGYSGISGYSGVFGGNSQNFTFSTSTTDSDPGSGLLRYNNATFASVTQIFIDNNNTTPVDVSSWIDTFDDSNFTSNRGYLTIYSRSNSASFASFLVTGTVVDGTGYRKLSVTPIVNNNGVFANNAQVIVSFAATGQSGYSGFCGLSGYSGFGGAGTSGYSGFGGGGASNIGNTIYVDAVNGNDGTGTRGRLDKPFLTISAAKAASGITAGDTIIVGPGTFTENSGVTLPNGVSLTGAGIGVTIIQSSLDLTSSGKCIINPGNNSIIADLTINGTAASGVYQAAIGHAISDTNTFTNAIFYRLKMYANSDGVYINGACSFTAYDCVFTSKFDCVAALTGGAYSIELYNCKLIGTQPFDATDHEPTRGLVCGSSGSMRMFGGSITVSAGDTANTGIDTDSTANVEAHNVRIDVSGTGALDLKQASSSVLKVNHVVDFAGADLVTSGTITYISYSSGYSGYSGKSGYSGYSSTSGYSGYCGLSGYSGYSGSGISGYSGYSGSGISGYSGFCGLSGYSGYSGLYGGISQPYIFDTTTTDSDPGSGKIRFNNATYNSVTEIYIDNNNVFGSNISTSWIDPWFSGSSVYQAVITVYKQNDSSVWAAWVTRSATVDGTGYRKIVSLSYYGHAGTFSNNDPVIVTTANSGADAIDGDSGISGYSGYSGSGVSGYSGFSGSGLSGYSGFCGRSGYSGFCGLSGYSGFCGLSGYSGYSGSGVSGYSGYSGLYGGISSLYSFDTATTDSDPGAGKLKFNNATLNSVTTMYIDIVDNNGTTITSWIDSWDDNVAPIRGQLEIVKASNITNYVTFNITGANISGANYRKIALTYVASNGSTFSASDPLIVTFSPAGSSGYSGYSGSGLSGYSGYCGLSGYSGFCGLSGYSGYCGLSGYSGYSGAVWRASITVETPTASESIIFAFTTTARTVSKIIGVITGSTSVTCNVAYGTNVTSLTNISTSDKVVSSTTTGDTFTLNNTSIPANGYLVFKTSALSGTPTLIHVTLEA